MAIDESDLSKGQVKILRALRKSGGNKLGEVVLTKWLAGQASAPQGKGASGFAVTRNEKPIQKRRGIRSNQL